MRLRLVSAELLVLVRMEIYTLLRATAAAFLELRRTTTDFYGDGMGQGTKYGLKETIQEGVVSGYVSYPVRKRTTRKGEGRKNVHNVSRCGAVK